MSAAVHKHGPIYNVNGAVLAKFRRMAAHAGSIAEMDPTLRYQYGEAVLEVVRALQRSALQRELPSHNVSCPSGCSSPDGKDIIRHIQNAQRASLAACPDQVRRARKPEEWQEMYEAAMKEKREREAARVACKPKLKPRRRCAA